MRTAPRESRHLAASGIVSALKSVWRDSWGPRLEYVLYASVAALLDCENATFLGVPVVNIGSRQQGRERGHNVVDVDYDRAAIVRAIGHQSSVRRYPSHDVYGDGKAGQRIAQLLTEVPLTVEKRLAY